MPPEANIPYEWQVGNDKDKLVMVVPSWSRTEKESYAVFMDKETRELRCECKGFQMNGECHHVHGLKWFCARPQFRRHGRQPTSLEAWSALQDSLGDKQKIVYDALRTLGEASNKELSVGLGWPINCITPRMFELRQLGLVEFSRVKVDVHTGRSEIVWKAVE
jgi:hypothetical protein